MFPINLKTQNNEYKFDLIKNKSDTLVISFNHFGSNDLDSSGFDEKYLSNIGVDVLFCKTNSNDWFYGLNTNFLSGILDLIDSKYKKKIFYGSSMGAYAAIYFASHFPNSKVIAVSPQYTPNSSKVLFEDRWKQEWSKLPFIHTELCKLHIEPGVEIDIIYDSLHLEDCKHVDIIKSIFPKTITLHDFKFTGHPSGYALNRAGIYRKVLNILISEKKKIPSFIYDEWNDFINNDIGVCSNKIVYSSNLGLHEFYKTSFMLLDGLFSLNPNDIIKIARNIQGKQKNLQRALCRAACIETNNPHIHAYTSLILARDGYFNDAREKLSYAIELDKNNSFFNDSLKSMVNDDIQNNYVIATMQKDEGLLLLRWAFYYIQITGSENILIIDNGSEDQLTIKILIFLEKLGIKVIRGHNKKEDFERKGLIILEECRNNFTAKNIFPIDCDEFIYAVNEGDISFIPSLVETTLAKMQDQINDKTKLIRIEGGRLNVPNKTAVMPWKAKRLLISAGFNSYLDVGLHLYDWQKEMDLHDTPLLIQKDIGILHCHYRTFEETVSKAKLKLKNRVESFSDEHLRNYKGAGVHLIPYLLMTRENYYNSFLDKPCTDISKSWLECYIPFPFNF